MVFNRHVRYRSNSISARGFTLQTPDGIIRLANIGHEKKEKEVK